MKCKFVSVIEQDGQKVIVEFPDVKTMADHYEVTPCTVYVRMGKQHQKRSAVFGTDKLFRVRVDEDDEFMPDHMCKNCKYAASEDEEYCSKCSKRSVISSGHSPSSESE